MSGFNQQFILSIILIGLGYLLKVTGLLKETDGEAISRLIFNLTLPALIITSFYQVKFDWSLLILVAAGILMGFLFVLLGVICFNSESRSIKGMLVMMLPGYNIGLFAYPLVEGIWGAEGIKYFGMFDVGNAFIVFGLSYLIGSYYADNHSQLTVKASFRKLSQSIPLMSYFIIFILSILQIDIPGIAIDLAEIIAMANMPLSLLLLGLYLNFSVNRFHIRLMTKFIGLRYGVALIIAPLLYWLLPVDSMIKSTLLIGFLLPIPLSLIPYGVEFKYDKQFIGTSSNVTMLLSFALIWVIVNLI
ncbi:AEC family transporter [Amphibacillus sediminis]|uniref:AEC family transporter n=1 Tax=Amphibacillus sediminis TaxID=360185 RepID=UPI00082A1C69|nr:AEC family transporter [Amphibacillus sediminis]